MKPLTARSATICCRNPLSLAHEVDVAVGFICEDVMYRAFSGAAALLVLYAAGGASAAAGDAATCQNGSGNDAIAACTGVIERDPTDAAAYYPKSGSWRH